MDPLAEITARLERLERANRRLEALARRWRWAGLAAIVGAVVLVASGADVVGVSKEVQAHKFTLLDQDKKRRAVLEVWPNGTTFLGLFDKENLCVAFEVPPDGDPGVHLYDRDGKHRLGFGIDQGAPGLGLFDPDGKHRIGLTTSVDGVTSALVLTDEKGRYRVDLGVNTKGEPYIRLSDNDGTDLFKQPRNVEIEHK